jgi:TPR repeat protein
MFQFVGHRAQRFALRALQRQTNTPDIVQFRCLHSFGGSDASSQRYRSRWFHTTKLLYSSEGDIIYQQAIQAMEQAKVAEVQKEQERSLQMYEAWKQAQEAETNPKMQGVKVVKTLVKETRKDKKTKKGELAGAFALLEKAAYEHEHPEALVQLGNLALQNASKKGNDPSEMISKALNLFQRAGVAGSRVGWYNLGQLYWTGYPTAELDEDDYEEDYEAAFTTQPQIMAPDLHEAMEAFVKAIDLGDRDAMYLVGVYRMTAGGRENIHSGLNLIKKAADGGHGGALYYIALLNLNGEPNIGLEPCTPQEFVVLLDRVVESGNVDSRFTRGHSYYHGTEGYPQSYDKALDDFIIAAEDGHAEAAVSAGAMLHTGLGVPKDQRRAFELYQLAGELGSKEGWQNVVACYIAGEGVPQSLQTARYIRETMLKESEEK